MMAHLWSKILLYQMRLTLTLYYKPSECLYYCRIELSSWCSLLKAHGPCWMASFSATVSHMKRDLPFLPPDCWCNMIQTAQACWKWFNFRKIFFKKWEGKSVEQKCMTQGFTGQRGLWSFLTCYSFFPPFSLGGSCEFCYRHKCILSAFSAWGVGGGGNHCNPKSNINICFSSI